MPQGGLTDEQQATRACARARGAHRASATAAASPAPPPSDDDLLRIMEFAVGGAEHGRRTCRCSKRSSRLAAKTGGRPAGARTTSRPTVDFRVVDHRRRHVGPARRAPAAAGRRRRSSISRRTPTSAAPGSRTRYPGCRVDNPNHNYSYSFAQRHDWPLHFSTQDVLLDYFRALRRRVRPARRTSASRPRCASATWSDDDAHVDGATCATPTAHEETLVANAVDQRGRPAQPAALPRHRRAATRSPGRAFHSARWDHDVDLTRQARRGDRHRRERGAVHPRDRARRRRAARVPAHAAVARARRPTTTTPCRAGLRWLLRARARRTASGTASGSSGAWATACSPASRVDPDVGRRRTASVERDQRHHARRCSPTYLEQQFADRPDLLDNVVPDVPARREAAAARQRRVGRRAEARQRAARHRRDPRDHADGHRHRRRRRSTTST